MAYGNYRSNQNIPSSTAVSFTVNMSRCLDMKLFLRLVIATVIICTLNTQRQHVQSYIVR